MLVDQTNGKLEEAKKFAEKVGLADQLEGRLKYLQEYGDNEVRCTLFPDFAPYSFAFLIEREGPDGWSRWFNGGLIYHGAHDRGGDGGLPTLSVCLTPTTGWSVHT
jgi:hypothetical protein